jgi:hypothetical protein
VRRIIRPGTNIAIERESASNGELQFVAYDVDTRRPARGHATREEAERLCPEGYVLYEQEGRWRARAVQ